MSELCVSHRSVFFYEVIRLLSTSFCSVAFTREMHPNETVCKSLLLTHKARCNTLVLLTDLHTKCSEHCWYLIRKLAHSIIHTFSLMSRVRPNSCCPYCYYYYLYKGPCAWVLGEKMLSFLLIWFSLPAHFHLQFLSSWKETSHQDQVQIRFILKADVLICAK